MNREANSNRHGVISAWPLRALRLQLRRRWRNWWRRVCERSPGLCLQLESARKKMFRFDPEVPGSANRRARPECGGAPELSGAGDIGTEVRRHVAHQPTALLGLGDTVWRYGHRAHLGFEGAPFVAARFHRDDGRFDLVVCVGADATRWPD